MNVCALVTWDCVWDDKGFCICNREYSSTSVFLRKPLFSSLSVLTWCTFCEKCYLACYIKNACRVCGTPSNPLSWFGPSTLLPAFFSSCSQSQYLIFFMWETWRYHFWLVTWCSGCLRNSTVGSEPSDSQRWKRGISEQWKQGL